MLSKIKNFSKPRNFLRSYSEPAKPSLVKSKPYIFNAGLKFNEITIDNDGLNQVAIRQAIAKKIAKDERVQKIIWRETTGIAELDQSKAYSLPFAPLGPSLGLSLNFGFQASSLLLYRFLRPVPVYNWQNSKEENEDFVISNFPVSACLALKLPIGHEVELKGAGRLLLSQGICLAKSVGIKNIVYAGTQASLGTFQSTLGEYSLKVMAIDGHKIVRITLTKTNENMAGIEAQLRAGILGIVGLTPNSQEGILKKLLQNSAKAQVEDLVKSYGSLVCNLSNNSQTLQTTICCYDLDLSKPLAQKAYDRLLCLGPALVDELLHEEDSGIQAVRFSENEKKSSQVTDIQAFSRQFLLHEIADIDYDGVVIAPDGVHTLYCERTYREKFTGIITGDREIRWEGIEIIDDDKNFQDYYRFYYEELANIPSQQDVDKFFWLADKLGIKSRVDLRSELIEMSKLQKLVSNIDNTRAKIEIFFTKAGVSKLQEADANIGLLAFQSANNQDFLPVPEQAHANKIIKKYQALESSWWAWFGFEYSKNNLVANYEQKFKRNFDEDYYNFNRAKLFGDLIAQFSNAQSTENARNFFAALGKSPSFEYQEILAALVVIAGRENVLVHELSMSGGNIMLESLGEGEIKHPRDHVKNLFSRNPERE